MATPAWSVLPDEWKALLKERGLRPFRADQILQSLYRDYITDWDQATTLPKDFRETLKVEFPIVPADGLFEKPFKDTSWTNDWVHFSRRGIIVVPKKNKNQKSAVK